MTSSLLCLVWKKLKKLIPQSYITHKIYWIGLEGGKTQFNLNTYKNGDWVSAYCGELK